MLTEAQKVARRRGIGGSDVSSVFSLEPYGCKLKLFHDKTGVKPDFESMNGNMERGIYLEDIACAIYEQISGNTLKSMPQLADKVYPWMLANVDRMIETTGRKVLEVKCPSRDSFYRMKTEGVPDYYILQGQHYMYVTKAESMEYAIFCADTWEMEIVPVERDDVLINKIIEQEKLFWEQKEAGIAPDRLPYGDKRCKLCDWRLGCWKDEWNELDFDYIKKSDYEEVEDEAFEGMMTEYAESTAIMKRVEARVDKVKRAIITFMGDKFKVQLGNGKVSFKWEKKTYTNSKQLAVDHPEIIKKYEYVNSTRSLRVYPKKEKK